MRRRVTLAGLSLALLLCVGQVSARENTSSTQAAPPSFRGVATVTGVADGDTLWMGEVSVRLAGIDAPEGDQICRQGSNIIRCGAESSRHLEGLITGALVTCTVEGEKNNRSDDTFGRPMVNCEASRGEQKFDLAQRMVEDGYAMEYKGQIGDNARVARVALDAQRGIMHACSLRPDIWRTDARAQVAFRDRGIIPQAALTMGHCPPPTRRPQGSGGPAPVQP